MPDMFRLSTDEIREAERFDQWRSCAQLMQGVTEHWVARSEGAFRGAVEVCVAGSLRRSRVTSAMVARVTSPFMLVNTQFLKAVMPASSRRGTPWWST